MDQTLLYLEACEIMTVAGDTTNVANIPIPSIWAVCVQWCMQSAHGEPMAVSKLSLQRAAAEQSTDQARGHRKWPLHASRMP